MPLPKDELGEEDDWAGSDVSVDDGESYGTSQMDDYDEHVSDDDDYLSNDANPMMEMNLSRVMMLKITTRTTQTL